MRGVCSLWKVQSSQVSGMLVWLPKNSSSRCFGAERRQLDADARLFVHPFDLVASEASVLAHQRFTRLDILGILERNIDAGVFLLLAMRHQERGQRFSFMIGQPQRRHRSMR